MWDTEDIVTMEVLAAAVVAAVILENSKKVQPVVVWNQCSTTLPQICIIFCPESAQLQDVWQYGWQRQNLQKSGPMTPRGLLTRDLCTAH